MALSNAQLAVDHGRVIKDDMPLAHRRAVLVHEGHRLAGHALRQLPGVGNRGGTADKLGPAPVKSAQALQPAQHVGQVGAEHAAVGVDFVDDDILQVFKQLDPLGMPRENGRMEHIGVGDDNMARLPDGTAGCDRGVAVVGIGLNRHVHGLNERVQLVRLVRRKRFGGKQIQRAAVRVFQNGVQDGQVIAERLARGRRRDHDHMLSPQGRIHRLTLMGVERLHAARPQHGGDARVNPGRKRRQPRRLRRYGFPMRHVPHERRVGTQAVQELFKVHRVPPWRAESVNHIIDAFRGKRKPAPPRFDARPARRPLRAFRGARRFCAAFGALTARAGRRILPLGNGVNHHERKLHP